jgi:hypothetical protein
MCPNRPAMSEFYTLSNKEESATYSMFVDACMVVVVALMMMTMMLNSAIYSATEHR